MGRDSVIHSIPPCGCYFRAPASVGGRRADIVRFFVHQPRLPPKICLNYEHHETVTGNQEPERTWMIATLFAAMVFVNLVTIFKVYCNITVLKGK